MEAYSENYSEHSFFKKLRNFAAKAGKDLILKVLILYYASKEPGCPAWAKAAIYGALGYFVLPTDVIPDFIPGIGYTDDLAILAGALCKIAMYITPKVKEAAKRKMQDWFEGYQ